MRAYIFNPENGQFMNEIDCQVDKLASIEAGREILLIPQFSTTKSPVFKSGTVPVWDGENWNNIEDNRGVKYWNRDAKYGQPPLTMTELGALPDGAMLSPPKPTEEEIKAMELISAKMNRANEVSKIVVEVDGMSFDGDEDAQTRMTRAIISAMATGADLSTTTTKWVLSDSTVAEVTIEQLARANLLAGKRQTELWVKPYE